MFNKQKLPKLRILTKNAILLLGMVLSTIASLNAQTFTRGNSPYSRYGLGDLHSFQFVPSASMGGMKGAYNSVTEFNPANPASLGFLRYTAFDMGAFYQHSILNENSTGNTARANDGNLSYVALSFPITRAWEIEQDSLRRGLPIQWGMGFSLSPHSTVAYSARVTRNLAEIGDVAYQYSGEGTRYRVNWANGVSYKGLSLGANLGFLFGTVNDLNTIDFQDSAYIYAFDEQVLREEYTTGFLWDLGLQYNFYLKDKEGVRKRDVVRGKHITLGLYASGSNNMRVLTKNRQIRYGAFYARDTLVDTDDLQGNMQLPLTIGGGLAYSDGMFWKIGLNYESSFWENQFSFDTRSIAMGNSYELSLGGEYCPIPRDLDVQNYFQRIRYRMGAFYGRDPRIVGAANNPIQLNKYGLTLGLGLPIKPLKSGLLGYVNTSLEIGYLGHPDLIGETYFRVNMAFTLNDGTWFRRARFR